VISGGVGRVGPTTSRSSTLIQQTNKPICFTDIGKCVLGDRVLSFHSSGPDVSELQQRLQNLGFYKAQFDGNFGMMTEVAVKDFQSCP
jgi:hypothetical protein